MGRNYDDMIKKCKSKADKLNRALSDIRNAAREKRIPCDINDDALELIVQSDEFLQKDIRNLNSLIKFYKNVVAGIEQNVNPEITDRDVGTVFETTMYNMDEFTMKAEKICQKLLPSAK